MRASPPNGAMATRPRRRSRAQVVNDQVLILPFDRRRSRVNLEKLKEGLPTWAAVTFMDPDGMTARIGLKQRRALQSRPRSISPPSTSCPGIRQRPAAEARLAARRQARAKKPKRKRVAAIPPPACRWSRSKSAAAMSGDSSRIAFYWPAKVGYKVVSQGEGTLKLQFAKRAKADLAYLHISPPAQPRGLPGREHGPRLRRHDHLEGQAADQALPRRRYAGRSTSPSRSRRLQPQPAAQAKAAAKPKPVARKAVQTILLAPPKQLLQSDEAPAPKTPRRRCSRRQSARRRHAGRARARQRHVEQLALTRRRATASST